MTLAELLAANPSAQAGYDAAIAQARSEGEVSARDEMKAVIAKVSPFLTSASYDADVKEAGIKAITGEGHIATFETLATIADRDLEKAKAKAAEEEEGEETPPGGGEGLEAGAAYADKKKRLKGEGV